MLTWKKNKVDLVIRTIKVTLFQKLIKLHLPVQRDYQLGVHG